MKPMLVFLLEERSARAMLEGLLPRVLGSNADYLLITFEGKQDLEKNIVRKIKFWKGPEHTLFVIIRDQDSADCRKVVEKLKALCAEAGRPDSLVRVACRELESWYLGDLAAVEKGLGQTKLTGLQKKRKFRDPDMLGSPSQELKKLTLNRYQKVAGSRAVGPHLNLEKNTSYSFNKLLQGLMRCLPEHGSAASN